MLVEQELTWGALVQPSQTRVVNVVFGTLGMEETETTTQIVTAAAMETDTATATTLASLTETGIGIVTEIATVITIQTKVEAVGLADLGGMCRLGCPCIRPSTLSPTTWPAPLTLTLPCNELLTNGQLACR
jgi:hypothetical protein